MTVAAESPSQWTGIAVVESGRIYVNFPRWSPAIPMSVGYLDRGMPVAFPNEEWNSWTPEDGTDPEAFAERFVSVQSVVPGSGDTVWVLDTGNPGFKGVIPGGPRLFHFDASGKKVAEYGFAKTATGASYLNDVRFGPDGKTAYITDSGKGGLVVLDLASGVSHRALDGDPSTMATDTVVEIDGTKWLRNGEPPQIHADGIAIHGEHVYYQALTGRMLYRVPMAKLAADVSESERRAAVEELAEVGPSDGLIAGADGSIYLSSLELNAVRAYRPDGTIELIVADPLIAWPDSFSFGPDGALYVTTSRIHQGPNPRAPYGILRIVLGE